MRPTTIHRCPSWRASARGAWVTGRSRGRYLDCLAASFGGQLRSSQRRDHRHRAPATRRPDPGQPRIPLRPAGSLLRHAGCAVQQGHGAAMNSAAPKPSRAQSGRTQMGHRRQQVAGRVGQHRRGRQQFHGRTHHHRQLLLRRFRPHRLPGRSPGLSHHTFGDADAVASAIDENTVAVLVESDPGRAGIIMPAGRLPAPTATDLQSQRAADRRREIRSGLARTGRTFACEHWDVVPTSICWAGAGRRNRSAVGGG